MSPVDWMVLAAYAAAVLVIGLLSGRGHQTAGDFYLAGRRMPVWAVLCSMVATELSGATFLGVPHEGFTGDWTYLQFAVGSLAARIVLAAWFIRLYYRMDLVTVYGFLEQRFGRGSQLCSAWFFLVGRLVASGVRLFIAGLAFATVTGLSVEVSILLAGLVAGAYTLGGGMRAVIWTDTLQGAVFLIAAGAALVVVGMRLQGGLAAGFELAGATGKLGLVHLPPLLSGGTGAATVWERLGVLWQGLQEHYLGGAKALPVALAGGFCLTLATHGTDQDMVQRLLTARSGARGGRALVLSGLATFPLVALFLSVGTALWLFYRTGLSDHAAGYPLDPKSAFPLFIFHEIPGGIRGLIFAGLFAASMSSMDSAVNALATTWMVDVRRGSRAMGGPAAGSRRATVVFAALVTGCALAMVPYNASLEALDPAESPPVTLVQLALSAMTMVYGGLLGAFLVGLVTRRGSDRSVVVGMLAAGACGTVLFLQPVYLDAVVVAWPWWIILGTLVAFLIGATSGRRRP